MICKYCFSCTPYSSPLQSRVWAERLSMYYQGFSSCPPGQFSGIPCTKFWKAIIFLLLAPAIKIISHYHEFSSHFNHAILFMQLFNRGTIFCCNCSSCKLLKACCLWPSHFHWWRPNQISHSRRKTWVISYYPLTSILLFFCIFALYIWSFAGNCLEVLFIMLRYWCSVPWSSGVSPLLVLSHWLWWVVVMVISVWSAFCFGLPDIIGFQLWYLQDLLIFWGEGMEQQSFLTTGRRVGSAAFQCLYLVSSSPLGMSFWLSHVLFWFVFSWISFAKFYIWLNFMILQS